MYLQYNSSNPDTQWDQKALFLLLGFPRTRKGARYVSPRRPVAIFEYKFSTSGRHRRRTTIACISLWVEGRSKVFSLPFFCISYTRSYGNSSRDATRKRTTIRLSKAGKREANDLVRTSFPVSTYSLLTLPLSSH